MEVIHNLRHLPYECTAIFDANGIKLLECTCYSSYHVSATIKLADDDHYTDIHNHTDNAAFSNEDFASAIHLKLSKSIVIADKMIYTLELTPECWQLDPKEISTEYERTYQEIRAKGNLACRKEGSTVSILCTIAASQHLAEKYGFKFTAESYKKSDFYRLYKEQKKSDT